MTNKRTNESNRLLGLGSNIRDNILWNFFSSYFVKKERKNLLNDPTYFLFHVHNKFSSLNTSTPQISSIKISLSRGLIINFLLKFHVHYYGCMHGITQQTMASQLVQNTHNKNMSHLWLDMLGMSTTILINWNQKNCHIPSPPPKSPQKKNPCPIPSQVKSYCPPSTKEEMLAPLMPTSPPHSLQLFT